MEIKDIMIKEYPALGIYAIEGIAIIDQIRKYKFILHVRKEEEEVKLVFKGEGIIDIFPLFSLPHTQEEWEKLREEVERVREALLSRKASLFNYVPVKN